MKILRIAFVLCALLVLGLSVFPQASFAVSIDPKTLESQGPCKEFKFSNSSGDSLTVVINGATQTIKNNEALGYCIVEIYKWSLGIAVILALIMIILSGYMYMTAGGDAQKVTVAKEMFAGAFIGLIILFAAVVILRTINPDLVNFSSLIL
ncbi:MAG: pilin [bacterium]|nr:pilin [bacterium]